MAKRKKKLATEIVSQDKGLLAAPSLLADLRQLIEAARQQTARAVNSALVGMYWQIGRRIRKDVLANERAEYGKQVSTAGNYKRSPESQQRLWDKGED